MRLSVCHIFTCLIATYGFYVVDVFAQQPLQQVPAIQASQHPGAATDSTNEKLFKLPPDFQVELIYTVPKDKLGSWVNITADSKGRLIVSDQGDKGLCRVTPAPIGSKEPSKVEQLDAKIDGKQISAVQGMLFAFDSLYVSINGGGGTPGSGLYRLRDTNGDDQFDEVKLLKTLRGGGEHGPHALRLSPDGKSIVLICGNHTAPPFDVKRIGETQVMGGIRKEPLQASLPENSSSHIIPNWDEDLVLPRQWDGGGHAAGILAPGGWIAKTDPDGKTWDMISMGYRNPFDMAFNADGELFAYDADMEWDFGSPWYRPTRVVHATSGSEFGWRSGTGKWPNYYADSLPEVIDIGPGSPVGVEFGYGTKFPAKYQRALFICDWTFGTMYAIHLTPNGSSYKATKEEFISRTPLPLTDCTVSKDGALYFTIGGRGTQSELFRVTYVGKESTAPVDPKNNTGSEARALRQKIEQHHVEHTGGDVSPKVDFLVPHLASSDRNIRYAARVALERLPLQTWINPVTGSADANTVITGVIGLARIGDAGMKAMLLNVLAKLKYDTLSPEQKLDYLRAMQLICIRLGLPEAATRQSIIAQFEPKLPSGSDFQDRELVNLLIALESPTIVSKVVPLLSVEHQYSDEEVKSILDRNPNYAKAIKGMLEKQPDRQQMHFAFALRNAKQGWSTSDRLTYFAWFNKAREWRGGNSFEKFLNNIEKEAFGFCTPEEQAAIDKAGVRKAFVAANLPKAKGPGRDYTLDEILKLGETKLVARNFKNGQTMFQAARCVVCHRFAGDGGATGPDLTQVAGRFSLKDMAEAIVDPSKVVSDQYKATVVETKDGKNYVGRIVGLSDKSIKLAIDPEDGSKIIELAKENIETEAPSPNSMMPKDLLKALNQDEMLDLMAYLLSRGDRSHVMFQGGEPAGKQKGGKAAKK